MVTGESKQLIECVAERIAQRLLSTQHIVRAVQVDVSKPHVALPGHFDAMGVRVYRARPG